MLILLALFVNALLYYDACLAEATKSNFIVFELTLSA